MTTTTIGITGLGFQVGSGVRTNHDPIFDWLRRHNVENRDLFTGYKDRAVLEPGETVDSIMTAAARSALENAGVAPSDIDLIVGYASVSEYITPNALSKVHNNLGLPDDCWIMPVQSEYTNYLAGIKIADSLIRAGRVKKALLVCGTNWTRHVDYHQAACIGVGDGACAAVIEETSDTSRFAVVDAATRCATKWYGAMDMSPREMLAEDVPSDLSPFVRLGAYSKAVFNLDPETGRKAFEEFGLKAPPELVLDLLKQNGLTPEDITVISHQASDVLLKAWCDMIKPKTYLDTMAKFGNMTLASMGVTFASRYDDIDTDYLVLLGIGVQQETSALLLHRST